MRRTSTLALPLLLLILAVGCQGPGGDAGGEPIVARSGDHVLTVDEAAALIADASQLPNSVQVVEAMAGLWVDYVLLARAAEEDSTFSSLDLEPLVRRQAEQRMVDRLRDSVIQVDTAVTEQELRELWSVEAPGVRVAARHILLSYPDSATAQQRDSVMELAGELRRRVVDEGADFGALAREYSDDPGSAQRGGDLGTLSRGQTVPAFEEAAWALDQGEVSGPVESPFGVHVIQVTEKEVPSFEEERDDFARRIKSQRVSRAESTYVAGIEEPARIQATEDGAELARTLAEDPAQSLSGRAARRPLATYEGGELTAEEYQDFIQGQAPGYRSRVQQASDGQLEGLVEDLARGELLVARARESGFEVREAERDSLTGDVRTRLVQAAERLGVRSVEPREGESGTEAVDRIVHTVLQEILTDQRNVIPLGPVPFALRRTLGARIYEPTFGRVVQEVARIRSQESSGAQGETSSGGASTDAPATPPDSAR